MARKRRQEEHENHDRWLVSYADFITLLFAFFVVMYAISQVNDGKYRVLSESIITAFQVTEIQPIPLGIPLTKQNGGFHPVPLQRPDSRRQQQRQLGDIERDLQKSMQPLIKHGQVRVTQSSRGVMVEINASLLFQPGLSALEPQAVQTLSAVAQVLAGVNNAIQVEGHTDNLPISSVLYPSNWELSAARSSSVVRLFSEQGIAGERLAAVGYADHRPLQANDSAAGRARNRRVTVMVLPESPAAAGLSAYP